MTRTWPFFDDLLAKVEMVCAKADLDVARLSVEQLGGDTALLDELEQEDRLTVQRLLEIREQECLLDDDASDSLPRSRRIGGDTRTVEYREPVSCPPLSFSPC